MNLSGLVIRATKQSEFFLKKNAPTILTGAGIAGFIGTVALTIRATNQASEMMPMISSRVRSAKNAIITEEFTEQDKRKALGDAYLKSAGDLAQTYGPVILLGSASIVCVMSAHNMMLKRQASLIAAYTTLDASFRAYRKRVAEKIGDDEELELYRRPNMRALDQQEDGSDACQIDFENDVMPSPYARFFDETSRNWTKTPEYNLLFLRAQQDWANDRLRAYGFIFLNEVYEALGLERSQAGQIVGWKHKGNGDGFVDFGLYAIGDECNRAFVNGIEHTVLLDFNVDGIIKI